ncbi:MAG TPA: hypothetical protein VFC99_04330 [Acidimicrobiia bacterium]|nr:hypothetical protein [Acidimicrobiia bacterium]
MSTQLRLVETPPTAKRTRSTRRSARVVPAARGRQVRWARDWSLDTKARTVGRRGVAAAREALAQAERKAS